eukprot:UN12107
MGCVNETFPENDETTNDTNYKKNKTVAADIEDPIGCGHSKVIDTTHNPQNKTGTGGSKPIHDTTPNDHEIDLHLFKQTEMNCNHSSDTTTDIIDNCQHLQRLAFA